MFYTVPIEKRLDFHCIPPDLLTYPELEAISRQLANRTILGMGWRSSTENIRRLVRRVSQTVQFRPPRCGTDHHRSRIYGYGQVFRRGDVGRGRIRPSFDNYRLGAERRDE